MEIRVLGCYGGEMPGHRTTCLMLDNRLLIDAGAVTAALPLKDQAKIEAIVLSHAHLDHIRDLAFLADNIFGKRDQPVRIYGLPETIAVLRDHVFNAWVWPDFSKLPKPDDPVISFHELKPGEPAEIAGFELTPVRVNHTVEAAGYLIKNGDRTMIFSGDTGPTHELWKRANQQNSLHALFIEASFPDRLSELAETTGHLTPALAARELEKINHNGFPVYVFHMKPQYLKEILGELESADSPLKALAQGDRIQV